MKTNKIYLIVLLVLAMAGTTMAQQWHELHTGVTEDLYDVCCIDTNTVFVCGKNGVILKSTNGGTTWEEKFRYEGMDLYDLCFIDDNTGFAIGNYGESLAKTTDGGEHWTWIDIQLPEYPDNGKLAPKDEPDEEPGNVVKIFPIDADTLYFTVEYRLVAKSTDGGLSASFVFQDLYNWWDIYLGWSISMNLYFEDNVGYVFFNDYFAGTKVFKTVDYGNTWDEVFVEDLWGDGSSIVHFIDKDKISVILPPIISTYPYNDFENYFYTENGFATTLVNQCYINQIACDMWQSFGSKFTTAEKGCLVAGAGNSIYGTYYQFAAVTNDGGLHWNYCDVGNHNEKYLLGVDGVENTYYIVSEAGTVYTNRAGFNTIQSNIPNVTPANPSYLEIYDLQGRLLRTQNDNIGKPDTEGLAAGTYIIRIVLENGESYSDKIIKQ